MIRRRKAVLTGLLLGAAVGVLTGVNSVFPKETPRSLLLTDSEGAPRGEAALYSSASGLRVPLKSVADAYRWPRAFVIDQEMIWLPDRTISLRAGTPFVQVRSQQETSLQLLGLPIDLGGTLGVSLDDCSRLFDGLITLDTTAMRITLGEQSQTAPTSSVTGNTESNEVSFSVELMQDLSAMLEPSPVATDDSSRVSMAIMGVIVRDSTLIEQDVPPDTRTSMTPTEASSQIWTLRRVMIDPGHGGRDPGAVVGKLQEKDVVLDIALRLAHLLTDAGIEAKLTRHTDEFVALRDRTSAADRERADLLISIHCNYHPDTSIGGVEAYFLSPARTQRAIEVALLENAAIELEDSASYQSLADENYILAAMATSRNLKDSETWAAWVMREVSAGTRLTARGVDQAAFYVLMGATMPAVLVECGYLSHSADARFLSTAEGRQRIAAGLLKSILKTKSHLEAAAR